MISEGLDTLKNLAKDMNEVYSELPLLFHVLQFKERLIHI